MNTTATTARMEKIKALLAMAEDSAATPAEAEAFNDKAAELMAQHGIEMAMPEADGDTAEAKRLKPGVRLVVTEPPRARDAASLMIVIAQSLRCRTVRHPGRWPNGQHHTSLIGFASDLDRADILYQSLLTQMHTGLAAAEVPIYDSKRAYRNSWVLGFISAVGRRLNLAEQQAARDADTTAESGTTALVLANRDDLVDRAVNDAFPNLRRGTARRSSGGGYQSGFRAGQRADLNHNNHVTGPRTLPK